MPDSSALFAFAIIAAICSLAAAVLLLGRSASLRRSHGLPSGRVIYSDTGSEVNSKPLFSARYGLAGKPDYLVATPKGLVPVEVKPERTDPEPHASHLLQVLAYCLLLEEGGERPPYGLLRYKAETFRVDYNPDTREHLLNVISEMREMRNEEEVHRSHKQPGRCRGCAYRDVCGESLWPSR